MSLMVSVSGIRGIVGDTLTPPVIMNYVISFIHLLGKPQGRILIGRDTRRSGESIEKVLTGTITAMGYDILNIGIATTPTVLLLTRKMNCIGGIAITASHNSSEWNALKLCDEDGLFLKEERIRTIEKLMKSQDSVLNKWKKFDKIGLFLSEDNASLLHIDEVKKIIDQKLIKKKKFRVAIDPGGGTGAVIDRPFLEGLGCNVVAIYEKPESKFPRKPEPIPENLSELCSLVKDEGADIGFAQDPDGDRLSVVSENGVAVGEEYTLVLAGEAYLRRNKTDIACNLSTSMMIDDLGTRFGVNVKRTRIGEIYVTDKLLENNLHFGGEGNGGVIVTDVNPCRDSIVAMGLTLELLAKTDKKLSQIVDSFPSYVMKKEKLKISRLNRDKLYSSIFEKAKKQFYNYKINELDGIKIYNKFEWLHVRLSNTEPVLRIMAESESEERTDELIKIGKYLSNMKG